MRIHLILFVSVLSIVPAAWPQTRNATKDEGWSDLLPAGKDKDLVISSCTNSCHNLKVVVEGRKTRADWEKSVNDMIQRGAPIFPEETEPIISYLAKVFGPEVPHLVNVNAAGREELQKVPNLKPEIATRIVELRVKSGPFKNAEELRKALAMEKDDFEKIRYLLKYSN